MQSPLSLTNSNSILLKAIVFINIVLMSIFARTIKSQETLSGVRTDALSGSVAPSKETKVIGIRKIYAPESRIQKWPLGDEKYVPVEASKFEHEYNEWKTLFDASANSPVSTTIFQKPYIVSARYVAQLTSSGELSGYGKWIIQYNKEFSECSKDNKLWFDHCIILPDMQLFMDELTFTSETVDKSSSNNTLSTENPPHFLFGSLPSGKQIFYSDSNGVLNFKWTTMQIEPGKYILQAPPGLSSEWELSIPKNKKITLRTPDSHELLSDAVITLKESGDKSADEENCHYVIRLSNSQQVLAVVSDINQNVNDPNITYQQDTTYVFYPHQFDIECKFIFTLKENTNLPPEFLFNTVHNPGLIWTATLDGESVEVHSTNSGYCIWLNDVKKSKPINNTATENNPDISSNNHTLVLKSSCTMEEFSNANQVQNDANTITTVKYPLPRIELENGVWINGKATCNTIQKPQGLCSNDGDVSEFKITPQSRYITTVELFNKQSDVFITFSPFNDSFYSQNDTVVHWDGAKISFMDSIYLWSEQGRQYVLTARLPERLSIDKVQISPSAINDEHIAIDSWEIKTDVKEPHKQVLVIYLHESIRPGHPLLIDIYSHIITSFEIPVTINMLQPVLFEGFHPHRQSVQLCVSTNQKFTIGNRTLYPQSDSDSPDSDNVQHADLPDGIVQMQQTDATDKNNGKNGVAYIINVEKWGDHKVTISPVSPRITAQGEIHLIVKNQRVLELIHLNLSNTTTTKLNSFHFEFPSTITSEKDEGARSSSCSISDWKCTLTTSDKQFCVPVRQESDGHFVVEFPTGVATPFTLNLSRQLCVNGTYETRLLRTSDCSSINILTSVNKNSENSFQVKTRNLERVVTQNPTSDQSKRNKYTYTFNYVNSDSLNNDNNSPYLAIHNISQRVVPTENNPSASIWAWTQHVKEYHFGGGSVLASVKWDIENRRPPEQDVFSTEQERCRIRWTIPDLANTSSTENKVTVRENKNSPHSGFITGLWIDNVLVSSLDIRDEGQGTFSIPAPVNKERFTIVVQWTLYNDALSSINAFHVQNPVLNASIFQSKWSVYYPTTYRQLLSFQSSDSMVDGFFPRLFGPLIHNESNTINSAIQFWKNSVNSQQTVSNKTSVETQSLQFQERDNSNDLLNSLASTSWNCYSFTGALAQKQIYVIRSEVSECLRWCIFVISLCGIFILRHALKKVTAAQSDSHSSENHNDISSFNRSENSVTVNPTAEKIPFTAPESSQIKQQNSIHTNHSQLVGQISDSQSQYHTENSIMEKHNHAPSNWGFRRWLLITGIVSAIFAQILPWVFSIPFSALFMSTALGLLVFGMQNNTSQEKVNSDDSPYRTSSFGQTLTSKLRQWFFISLLVNFILLQNSILGQQNNAPQKTNHDNSEKIYDATKENSEHPILPQAYAPIQNNLPISQEYSIFIPTDETQQPLRNCYIPQRLLELMYRTNLQIDHSWIVHRATYAGQLIQPINKIETTAWSCSLEIETFKPNTVIEFPSNINKSLLATSDIVVRERTENNTHGTDDIHASKFIWGSPMKLSLQWNEQHRNWSFHIIQPGQYLIEIKFQPQITTIKEKNKISFPIISTVNSVLELTFPKSISKLEFPGSVGAMVDLAPKADGDGELSTETKMVTKRIALGTANELTILWDSNQSTLTVPSYNVDMLAWWHVFPDYSTLKVRYNLHVESGSVSSIRVSADPRLVFLSNHTESNASTENFPKLDNVPDNNTIDVSEHSNQDSHDVQTNRSNTILNGPTSLQSQLPAPSTTPGIIVPSPSSGLVAPPNYRQEVENANVRVSTSQIQSITCDNIDKNTYVITFKNPVSTHVTFDMEFIWNQSSIGAPQFPTGVFPDGHTGRRLLAFTFEPQLHTVRSSNPQELAPISVQNFFSQWTDSDLSGKGSVPSSKTTLSSDVTEPTQTLILPPPPEDDKQMVVNTASGPIPDMAYDLTQSKRRNDSDDNTQYICLNIQPVPHSAQAKVEASMVVYETHLLCLMKWDIFSSKGKRSGYSVELPDSLVPYQKDIDIISTTIRTDKRSYNATAYLHEKNLELYWGTPISGDCTVELAYELKIPQMENNSLINFQFEFPKLGNIDIKQYKFALFRTDSVKIDVNPQTTNDMTFVPVNISVESPVSDRHQQLVGVWETPVNNSLPTPVPFPISIYKNVVQASIDYTATLLLENKPTLIINGIVNVKQGILDEIEFQFPDYYGQPTSSKASIVCQANTESITSNSYYLRSQLPFTSGSEFQLSIPLKTDSKQWVVSPVEFLNIDVSKAVADLPKIQNGTPIHWECIQLHPDKQSKESQSNISERSLIDTQYIGQQPVVSQKWIHIFDMKYYIQLVSENQYFASAEFAVIQTGEKQITVKFPKNCTIIDIQTACQSVQWSRVDQNTILIPVFAENEIFDIRIVYRGDVSKTLYSEPISINPIQIEGITSPVSVIWSVIPWKKFNKIATNNVHQKQFMQTQNLLLNNLISQMVFVQNRKAPVTDAILVRFQTIYSAIESQTSQFVNATKGINDNQFRVSFKEHEVLRNKYHSVLSELQEQKYVTNAVAPLNDRNIVKQTEQNKISNGVVPQRVTEDDMLPSPMYAHTESNVPIVLELNISSGVKPWRPIWWILSSICIPVFVWLAFFPPVVFRPWRPGFVLASLGIFWLLEFNLYGVALLLIGMAIFDFLKKLRNLSKPNIIPLRVR